MKRVRETIGKLKPGVVAVLVGVVLSAAGPPVGAYVLQGPHILELMVSSMGKAQRLRVSQQVFLHGEDREAEQRSVPEVLRSDGFDKIRSDIETDTIRRIHVVSGNTDLTVVDGEIAGNAPTRFDRYTEILRFRSRKGLVDRLKRFGVDTQVSSLGRFDGRVAYVVGANYPSVENSQLWVDQQSFLPLRWIVADTEREPSGSPLDIHYLEWKPLGKIWYPFHVAFFSGGRLVREIRVDDVTVDPELDGGLFDIGRLRSLHRPRPPDSGGAAGEEAVSEVQKVIEEFKKKFE